MKLLLNGEIVEEREAVISVLDHGFLYGMGLFETFRTYGGRPWLLERHAARLAESCRALGIAYAPDARRMREALARLLDANGMGDAYVRWSVSAGPELLGLPVGPYQQATEIVYVKELAPDHPDTRASKALRLLNLRRSGPENAGVRLKSFHYMNNILAKRELAAAGAGPGTEGLFLDGAGHICEGIVSNVFWLRGGILYTPSLDCGPLPGITRGYVIELAAASGVEVREGAYRPDDLAAADEVFVTNSVQEIVPVFRLEDETGKRIREFPTGSPGSLARQWMDIYRAHAEKGEAR